MESMANEWAHKVGAKKAIPLILKSFPPVQVKSTLQVGQENHN
jgi:hypothetical protein